MKILTDLRPYQREAVDKAKPHAGFLISMQQRTGKTLVALAITAAKKAEKLLVVCPKIAVKTWYQQVDEHLDRPPREMEVITFGEAWSRRHVLRKWAPDLMIVDESHRIKARGTKASRACAHIARGAKALLALTGTPIGQGYQDLWAQFRYLFPVMKRLEGMKKPILASRVFGAWQEFSDRYLVWGGFKKKKVVGYNHVEELTRIVHEHSFRVTLDQAKGHVTKIVQRKMYINDMSEDQKHVYEELESGLVTLVSKGKRKEISADLVITQINKMQQVTGGWILDDLGEAIFLGDYKINRLLNLLVERNCPHVVVFRFIHEIQDMYDRLVAEEYNVHVIMGGTTEIPKVFDVVLLQVQSGVSFDLSHAAHIVFFSWDYSYLNFEQTMFRILSYNSTKVYYDYLMARGTIDEVIYDAVTTKKNLASAVIDRYRSNNRRMTMDTQEVEGRASAVRKELTKKAPKKLAKSAAPKAEKATKAKAKPTPTESDDGQIKLDTLAEEANMAASKCRRILRAKEVERPDGRWAWKPGSQSLKQARKALNLPV